MASLPIPQQPPGTPDGPRARIIAAARRHFLPLGFARCSMDCIAAEVGMSKKTVYAHFATKDDLVTAVVESKVGDFLGGLEAAAAAPDLGPAERVHRVMTHIAGQMGEVSPAFLRDLQRLMPGLFARIEAIRAENLPRIWGRILADGIKRGHVRTDISPAFVAAMLLGCLQSLLQPSSLERLGLAPRDVITGILHIINSGILTPAGRKAYETNARLP